MRRFISILAAWLALALAAPAAAPAVTHSYCQQSLRGGGSLAPDPDVYQYAWDTGATSMVHVRFEGASGSYTVYEVVRYYYRNGQATRRFYCQGSGSTYSDGRTF